MRQGNIDNCNVGHRFADQLQRLGARCRLTDDFQIGFGPDQHAQTGKQDRVIVGNGDANGFHENSLGGKAATSASLAFDAFAIDILNRIVGNLDKNLLTLAS